MGRGTPPTSVFFFASKWRLYRVWTWNILGSEKASLIFQHDFKAEISVSSLCSVDQRTRNTNFIASSARNPDTLLSLSCTAYRKAGILICIDLFVSCNKALVSQVSSLPKLCPSPSLHLSVRFTGQHFLWANSQLEENKGRRLFKSQWPGSGKCAQGITSQCVFPLLLRNVSFFFATRLV
jgi:hypothetical protein